MYCHYKKSEDRQGKDTIMNKLTFSGHVENSWNQHCSLHINNIHVKDAMLAV